MKKSKKQKKLQKVAKILYEEFRTIEKQRYEVDAEAKMVEELNQLDWVEYDQKVSNKFQNFVLSIIKLKEKVRVVIKDNSIYINGNLNADISKSYSVGPSNDDIIDIRINDKGFNMSRNYGPLVCYQDPGMYEFLVEKIREKTKDINRQLLFDIMDDVMLKTNLNRESNLEQILD